MPVVLSEPFYSYLKSLRKGEQYSYKQFNLTVIISKFNLYAVIVNHGANCIYVSDFYHDLYFAKREAKKWIDRHP